MSDWPGGACLTAGTNTGQTPVPGCDLGSPDAVGSGALRLTPAATSKAGFTLFNQARTSTSGLDITFHQAQYSGSGADGIAFFLVDGSTNLIQPGLPGGALGYSSDGSGNGVANGLVGIGLDAFGNFSAQASSGNGCAAGTGPGSRGPGQTPNTVAIRGPGNGTNGYCFLGTSGDLSAHSITLHGASRAATELTVRIVFDAASVATRNVTVFLNGTQVAQVPAPQALIDASTFKFGFASSTGASTDVHEVWSLTIDSVVPVTPVAPITPAAPVVVTPTFTG